ncbi:hypothetical protein EJF36_16975 [Bacillus sp. HMF5848]|uniref:YuiB family protein n=1 Tax=Bacillus sp. HMF5848 TaxID=2495421 RepID=UPI000F76CA8C|nr:YuiB family protein [Bacillus sp. HMF5848]RSK28423.1 hypothetical protein EJF36_16975 [Bacillus sp. HMF5848]
MLTVFQTFSTLYLCVLEVACLEIPIFIISIVLFFVLFYGIGFLLNMVLRMTWVMAFIYPVIFILIVNKTKMIEYVRSPEAAFSTIMISITSLAPADIIILLSGFIGAIMAGITIKSLRAKGYQMF